MAEGNTELSQEQLNNIQIQYKDSFDISNLIMNDCIMAMKAVEGLPEFGDHTIERDQIQNKAIKIINRLLEDHEDFLNNYES